jgi:hypothetical protein
MSVSDTSVIVITHTSDGWPTNAQRANTLAIPGIYHWPVRFVDVLSPDEDLDVVIRLTSQPVRCGDSEYQINVEITRRDGTSKTLTGILSTETGTAVFW